MFSVDAKLVKCNNGVDLGSWKKSTPSQQLKDAACPLSCGSQFSCTGPEPMIYSENWLLRSFRYPVLNKIICRNGFYSLNIMKNVSYIIIMFYIELLLWYYKLHNIYQKYFLHFNKYNINKTVRSLIIILIFFIK